MVPRRVLRSFAGAAVVSMLVACNVVVGNEDITYVEGETTPGDPGSETPQQGTPKKDSGLDAGVDAKDAGGDDANDTADGGGFDAADDVISD